MTIAPVRRAFADLPFGQVHYRTGGDGAPLLLLHPSPGSARQMLPLIERLAPHARVVAPDTPGNGDSAPLETPEPAIADYAAAMLALLDALGLARVDVYGSHTGACIAAELAVLAPDRVRRVVLDGIGVFDEAMRAELLARYALPFTPDPDGAYLLRAFMFLRDQMLFFPWYARTKAARRDAGLRSAADLHIWLVELLKAAETYPLSYRAAFRWDAAARLPLVTQRTLATAAADDPLAAGTRRVAAGLPDGAFVAMPRGDDPDFARLRTALVVDFIGA